MHLRIRPAIEEDIKALLPTLTCPYRAKLRAYFPELRNVNQVIGHTHNAAATHAPGILWTACQCCALVSAMLPWIQPPHLAPLV